MKKPRKAKPKPKVKTGRKTKYSKARLAEGKRLAEKGLTDLEIAKIWGVSIATITNWKKKYPEFLASLKKGKLVSDENVVVSLYQRATGYSHPEEYIAHHLGKILRAQTIKHYPPDVTACIFWLCNRKPDDWKSVNKERAPENPNTPVTVDFKFSVVNDEK